MTLDKNGVINLALAVFEQAKADYIYLKAHLANPNDKKAHIPAHCGSSSLGEIEYGLKKNIILSDFLSTTQIDADDVIKNWEEQGVHERWRVQHGCNKCKEKECIYKVAGHYTVKPYECIKE